MERQPARAFPNVSVRWLLAAVGVMLVLALGCAWLTLCLLFWQGSWQLLYHPKAAITRTPSSVGLTYEPIHFGATETGIPQLSGWWIPSQDSRYTVLYLHGADGNLSDSVPTLASLNRENLSIFAFDYRGYGQSRQAKPSEEHLRQDAESALTYLTQTRHIPANSILVYGTGLGANLAAETASQTPLAGVVLDEPEQDPLGAIFRDSRSKLVPARWIVGDQYDLASAAASLRIPSLWLITQPTDGGPAKPPNGYEAAASKKTSVTLRDPIDSDPNFGMALKRWLDDL